MLGSDPRQIRATTVGGNIICRGGIRAAMPESVEIVCRGKIRTAKFKDTEKYIPLKTRPPILVPCSAHTVPRPSLGKEEADVEMYVETYVEIPRETFTGYIP